MTALLDAGKAAGAIRPDVDARDVILLIGNMTRLDEEEWDTRHLGRAVQCAASSAACSQVERGSL